MYPYLRPLSMVRSALFVFLAFSLLITFVPNPTPTRAAVRTLSNLTLTDGTINAVGIYGDYVVYRADYDVAGRFDLYSAPINGGVPVRLSTALPLGIIKQFKSAGDHMLVVVRLDENGQQVLYSVPLAGGEPLQLTPDYADNLGTNDLEFRIAGDRVIYRIDQDREDAPALYSVPLAGGESTRLSVDLPDTSGIPWYVGSFELSADNATVAYTMVLKGVSSARLYVVPSLGGQSSRIDQETAQLVSFNGQARFGLNADGSTVAFVGRNAQSAGETLNVADVAEGTLDLIAQSDSIGFTIAPDGAHLVYAPRMSGSSTGPLIAVPFDGGATRTLTDTAQASFFYSPDSADIYVVPPAGGLSRVPVAGGAIQTVLAEGTPQFPQLRNQLFSTDGEHLLFLAYNASFERRLYSYDTTGTAPALAINDPSFGELSGDFRLSGDRAIYSAYLSDSPPQLYSVPIGGGASVKINGEYTAGEDTLILYAASDTQVVFAVGRRYEFGSPFLPRLLRVPNDGLSAPTLIDTSRAIVSDVLDFAVSPVDGRAVYLADQDARILELYSVPLAGGDSTRISVAGEGAASFAISPVGGRVAVTKGSRLYSVPIAGGAPTDISGYGSPTTINNLTFSPDGNQLFFLVPSESVNGASDLYRAPSTGGEASIVAAGVGEFQFTPDGSWVVFIRPGFPTTLGSVPTAGGEPVSLGIIGITASLRISPDSARVVYIQGDPFGGAGGVVSQAITGGATTPLELTPNGETLVDFAITPDSTAVVYITESAGVTRLQQKPITGGNALLLAEAEMSTIEFVVTPQSDRVIYSLATETEPFVKAHSLLSVPLTGGAPLTLFPATSSSSSGLDMIIPTADGAVVLFSYNQELFSVLSSGGTAIQLGSPNQSTLYDVRLSDNEQVVFIEGNVLFSNSVYGGALQQLNAPLPQGRVEAFTLSGDIVAYRGISNVVQSLPIEFTGLRELFAADLPPSNDPLLDLSTTAFTVSENAADPEVEVRLNSPSLRTIEVNFAVTGGSAVEGEDFSLGTDPLVFMPGETVKRLPLTLIEQPGDQGTRTIEITISDPTLAAAGQLTASVITVTINDSNVGTTEYVYLPFVSR